MGFDQAHKLAYEFAGYVLFNQYLIDFFAGLDGLNDGPYAENIVVCLHICLNLNVLIEI